MKKFGDVWNIHVEGYPNTVAMDKFAELLAEKTGGEITLQILDTLQRLHVQNIQRQYPATWLDSPDRILAPAPGSGAQINHGIAAPQQPVFAVQLLQLEDCPGSPAFLLSLPDPGVRRLAFFPA